MCVCWSALWQRRPAARKAWPSGLRLRVLQRSDNPWGPNCCWHCGVVLLGRSFHVDHHPIPFRDVESQLCCGITHEHDLRNLKPACPACNTSHRFEPSGHTCFCGRSQCCCVRQVVQALVLFVVGFLAGALVIGALAAAAAAFTT
jgi:hypothetical protein